MIWSTRMLQLNALLIYVGSVPMKLTTEVAWLNGDALFLAVINERWSRWPWPWMFYPKWMSMLGTYSALLAEGSIAILVWTRWRLRALIVMAIFHIMLALMLDHVAMLSIATMVCLWTFVPTEASRALTRGIRRRVLRITLIDKGNLCPHDVTLASQLWRDERVVGLGLPRRCDGLGCGRRTHRLIVGG